MTEAKKIHFEFKHDDKKPNSAGVETKAQEAIMDDGEEENDSGKFDPLKLTLPDVIAELASYGIKHRPSKKLNYQLVSEIKAYEVDCSFPEHITLWAPITVLIYTKRIQIKHRLLTLIIIELLIGKSWNLEIEIYVSLKFDEF